MDGLIYLNLWQNLKKLEDLINEVYQIVDPFLLKE